MRQNSPQQTTAQRTGRPTVIYNLNNFDDFEDFDMEELEESLPIQEEEEAQPKKKKGRKQKKEPKPKKTKRSKKSKNSDQDAEPKELPSVSELEAALHRERYRDRYKRILRSTVALLVVAAAMAVLVVTLWMPVLQVYGNSMTATLEDGDIVVLLKSSDYKTGDMVAFYYNNKILIKRVIAQAGDWVDMDDEGNVTVNGEQLDEPYVSEKALGECDIEFPYQVPDERVFVMGDHRSVSIDSRSSQIGCVAEEQVVGILQFRVWPFSRFGNFTY